MAINFPSSPTDGQVFEDTTTGNRYVYNLSYTVWEYQANTSGQVGGAGAGAFTGSNGLTGSSTGFGDIFRMHSQIMTGNGTIFAANNAYAVGPIEIADGASLTIEDGSNVIILPILQFI